MTNKSNMTAHVRSNLTLNAGIITDTDHESCLHTDPDSIIEGIYSASVSDDQATEAYTTSNANFDYDVTFRKVGSQVTMTGRLTANATLSQSSFIVFQITDSNLLQESGSNYYVNAVNLTTFDTLPLQLSGNILLLSVSIFNGEGFKFTLTYNTEN